MVVAGIAAVAIPAVTSVAGAAISSGAASDASGKQQATSIMGLKQQDATNAFNRSNTQPFINAADNGLSRQQDLIGAYNDQIQPYQNALVAAVPQPMTQANLEATPGYQFTLSQGLKSTQNAAAARGLGVSGAALKGAAAYATGLSDQTYNTRFGQAQTLYGDASNNLSQAQATNNQLFGQNLSTINVGENAAVGSGNTAQSAAQNYGNITTASGNAQAAAGIAGGNALASGINGVGNAAQQYAANQQTNDSINGQYGSGNSLFGGGSNNGGNYSPSQIAAINNGSWTAADQRNALAYNDKAG